MPAPKGNSYWKLRDNHGRDKEFSNPEELNVYIQEYFDLCDNNTEYKITKDGIEKQIKAPIPYTIEGLALHLDVDIDTLRNYEKAEGYEDFFGTIKKAKLKVQNNKVVNGLMGKSNAAVTIFDLKNNHGYKDKQEIEYEDKTPTRGEYIPPSE